MYVFGQVDLGRQIPKIDLQGLPHTCWPKSAMVDVLASEVAKKKLKDQIASPYIFQEMEKYAPSWANVKRNPETENEEGANAKKLDLAVWAAAFDKYAISAALTEQMTFATAMVHKDLCLQTGFQAHLEEPPRGRLLGVWYDEVVRFVIL